MSTAELTTTTPKTYNGWATYETWNVNLWIDNDESSHNYWSEQAQSAYDNAEASAVPNFTRAERATLDLSATLKEQFENESQDVLSEKHQASVWSDLLSAALSEVNWHEIAEHMIAETEQDDEPEDESEDEPDSDAGDITTEDHCRFYQYGKLWLTLDIDAAAEGRMIPAIRSQMQVDGFFPGVFFISDHGNAHLMSLDNDAKETAKPRS